MKKRKSLNKFDTFVFCWKSRNKDILQGTETEKTHIFLVVVFFFVEFYLSFFLLSIHKVY